LSRFLTLLYHRVNDALEPGELNTPPLKFRQQMEYLARNHEILSGDDLSAGEEALIRVNSRSISENSRSKLKVLITFDDGYRDNYLNAYPVLREFDFPALVFLATGMVNTPKTRPRYSHLPVPDMLSWEEAREMARHGISFGAHTAGHPHLSSLNYVRQKSEISASIEALVPLVETRSRPKDDRPSVFFCYPYGDYNEETLKILRELGICFAFTTRSGLNDERTPPLELHRSWVDGRMSMDEFDAWLKHEDEEQLRIKNEE